MLLPADEDLALRDPALPGLRLLLDDEELGAWLGQGMQTPVLVRGQYLRYKRGNSCVLVADVDTGDRKQGCMFWAYAGHGRVKVQKSLEQIPADAVLHVDAERGLLATTAVGDRDLPALGRLADERRHRLLHRLLRDRRGLGEATLRCLRHNPCRRWVGLVETEEEPPVVLRVYRPRDLPAAVQAINAWAGGAPRTPRLLGTQPRRGVLAVEYLPGGVLPRPDPAVECADFGAAGAALATLHARPCVPLGRAGRWTEARAARAAARQLATLLPHLADDVHDLADLLASRLSALDSVRHPIHGDFSADQVVVGDDGRVGLLDLDASCLGDPAVDLACAAAAIARDVVRGAVTAEAGERRLDALHAGYAATAPLPEEARLATYQAAHLLRRAVEPFRLRFTPGWPEASRQLVARARHALSSPTVAGGAP